MRVFRSPGKQYLYLRLKRFVAVEKKKTDGSCSGQQKLNQHRVIALFSRSPRAVYSADAVPLVAQELIKKTTKKTFFCELQKVSN